MKPSPAILEPAVESGWEARPAPAFLLDLPPWHEVFFRNLADVFRPATRSGLLYARPGSFWPDVFVTSRLPWNRFAQSVACHVAFIVAIWGSVQLWPQKPEVVRPRFQPSDVIYYAPSEYLPPLDTSAGRALRPQKGEPEHAPQPIISVPAEADNRTQTIVTPSNIKLNHDVPLPNIVAWSQTPAQPAMPLASTVGTASMRIPSLPTTAIAPAAEALPANLKQAPMLSQAAVAPAPTIDAESSRTVRAPQAAVVQPAPRVDDSSARRLGDINMGHAQVVAPAPELPVCRAACDAGPDATQSRRRGRFCGRATSAFYFGRCRYTRKRKDHLARYSSRGDECRGIAGRQSAWNFCGDSRGQERSFRRSGCFRQRSTERERLRFRQES